VVGIETVQSNVLKNHCRHFFSKDVGGIARVEIEAIAYPVGFPSRTFIPEVGAVIGMFRGNANGGGIPKPASLVNTINKSAAYFV